MTNALKFPVGIEVGDCYPESAVQDACFSCWRHRGLDANKSEHVPKHNPCPRVSTTMIGNPRLIHAIGDQLSDPLARLEPMHAVLQRGIYRLNQNARPRGFDILFKGK